MGWKLDRNSVHACIGSGPTPFYKLYLKASFELPEQFTSHVGQVTNWAKEGLKSRHCYCTVYNQGQRECSGEHAREAMPSESCALAAGFLLSFKEIILRSFNPEYLPKFIHSTPALPAPRLCGKLLALPAEAGGKPYAMECTAAAFLISRSVIGDLGLITSRSFRRHLARFRLAFDLEFKAA